jgi:predicted DNA-binding transcriptional regulator YafY
MSGQMPPVLFQANEPIEIVLTAQEWQSVLAGLYEMPYRMSQQVIDKVRMQLNAHRPQQLAQQMSVGPALRGDIG